MNKIGLCAVILACLLVAAVVASRLPRVATATADVSNIVTVDVHKLREKIDMKALPRRDLPDEVYR